MRLLAGLVIIPLGGCLISNVPGTARPLGAGKHEFTATSQLAASKSADEDAAQVGFVGGGVFGLPLADLGYNLGLSSKVDVGAYLGASGNLGGTLKVLAVKAGPLFVAPYGQARIMWIAPAIRMTHAGVVATLGEGATAFTVGGFYGHMWGERRETTEAEATPIDGAYHGGALGFETRTPYVTRVMLELQRHHFATAPSATTGLLTVHLAFGHDG